MKEEPGKSEGMAMLEKWPVIVEVVRVVKVLIDIIRVMYADGR